MRWHIELFLEFALILVIFWRNPKLRWFESLIGFDFAANVMQFFPYRSGMRAIPQLIWIGGVVLAAPLVFMALDEARRAERNIRNFYHGKILAFWITAQLCCVSLQTQAGWVIPVNHVLISLDGLCFFAWSVLFVEF